MKENHKVIQYFQSYHNYFWQWEIDDTLFRDVEQTVNIYLQHEINSVGIPDGITIAYNMQIEELLNALSTVHFPPFGALLLALTATNNYPDIDRIIDYVFIDLEAKYPNLLSSKMSYVNLKEAKAFLKTISQLDGDLKTGDKRIELIALLFKDAHNSLGIKYKEGILKAIKNGSKELNECYKKKQISLSTLSKDFNTLALLHKKYPDVDSVLRAWKGLPDIEELGEEVTESKQIKEEPDLIQQLMDDHRTFFVGSLIKRLWSGIQLPMKNVHPGEMPLGGVSDIANKGKFDNLLLTEYANEDEVFLYRISNKEALFIRRETTPEEDLRTRIFLLDVSIKNWGTPKILSYASAVSLLHHPKNQMQFISYAIGADYTLLNLEDTKGIIEALQCTDHHIDASEGLTKFLEECEENDIEITLFTSKKTFEHSAMQKLFYQNFEKFGWVFTTDITGEIEVFRVKNGGKKLIKSIELPLKQLWNSAPKRKEKRRKKMLQDLSQEKHEYPILYGFPSGGIATFHTPAYSYLLLKRGVLFRADSKGKGFRLLTDEIRFHAGLKGDIVATIFEQQLVLLYWNRFKKIVVKTASKKIEFTEDLAYIQKHYYKRLLEFEDDLYLISKHHYHEEDEFFKIHLEDNFIEKIHSPDRKLVLHVEELAERYFRYFSGSALTNIKSIHITENNELIFNNKHILVVEKEHLAFGRAEETPRIRVSASRQWRKEFVFPDSSKIVRDKLGMLTFKSSNKDIGEFYMPSIIDQGLCLASETEFAGYDYFLPKESTLNVINIQKFQAKYLKPFIQNILSS